MDKIIIIPTGTIPTCKKGTRDASIINLTNFLSKKNRKLTKITENATYQRIKFSALKAVKLINTGKKILNKFA